MELITRTYVPESALNGVRIAKGSWLFEVADYAGVVYLNDLFVNDLPRGIDLVTVDSNVRFKNGLRPFGTVTGYAELKEITRSKMIVKVMLQSCDYKTRETPIVLEGEMSFALVNRETVKVVPIPKEIVEKFKK